MRFFEERAGIAVYVATLMLAFHWIWAVQHHTPVSLQRGGALIVLIGVILAGLPYVNLSSIAAQAEDRLPPLHLSFVVSPLDAMHLSNEREALRPAAIAQVIAERLVAFILVCLGTLVNGYGDLLIGC